MNINDLTKLDVKNIDYAQLRDQLKNRPDILIAAGLILASIYGSVMLLNWGKNENNKLETQIAEMTTKSSVAEETKTLQAEYNNFIQNFPQTISSDTLIEKISEFAANNNVQVLSFSPAEKNEDEYIELTTINIVVVAQNFKDVIKFLKDIENSPYATRIEHWVGRAKDDTLKANSGENEININANVKISAINFKNGK